MKAEALARERYILAEDAYVDIAARRVPRSVKGSTHRVKYRLALVVAGECVLPYDNDTGRAITVTSGTSKRHTRSAATSNSSRILGPRRHMEKTTMKTVTLTSPRAKTWRNARSRHAGKKQRANQFRDTRVLWKVLTAKRWEVLKAMAGQGPLTIREVARRVERDVKAVNGDVHALLAAGLLERTDKNQVSFPFEAIRGGFTLRAAWLRKRVPV